MSTRRDDEAGDGLFQLNVQTGRCMDVSPYIRPNVSVSISPAWFSQPVNEQLVDKFGEVPPLSLILKTAPDVTLDRLPHEDGDVCPIRIRSLAPVVAGKGPLSDGCGKWTVSGQLPPLVSS